MQIVSTSQQTTIVWSLVSELSTNDTNCGKRDQWTTFVRFSVDTQFAAFDLSRKSHFKQQPEDDSRMIAGELIMHEQHELWKT